MNDSIVKAEVERYKQWMIGATKPRASVLPKTKFEEHPERNYNLKNKMTHHFLHWEDQNVGINIGWTDDGSNETGDKVARWFFVRKDTNPGPIRFGEKIALGLGISPSFVRYEERTFGINLGYADSPSFEWKLLGGKIDDSVHTQELIAIYNEKAGECLISFDRTVGGDLGWPSSQTWGSALVDIGEALTKEAWEEAKKEALKALITAAVA